MLSRRAAMAAAATLMLGGCAIIDRPAPSPEVPSDGDGCRAPGELVAFDAVGGGTLLYADGDHPTSMRSEPGFLRQLNAWADDWAELSGLGAITSVTSYGAYVDKCHSYHQIGQAFDITNIEHAKGDVSLRFDRWSPGNDAELRNYWRLAASLHLHFAYTLAYPHNAQHHNHIHFDNMISGKEPSKFWERSKAQVHMVQHGVRHVFGHDVSPTGEYDTPTREAVRAVQHAHGLTDPLRTQTGWQGFLRVIARG